MRSPGVIQHTGHFITMRRSSSLRLSSFICTIFLLIFSHDPDSTIREAFKEKELEFDGLWTDADNVFWTKMVESMVPNVRELASKVNKDIRAVDPNTPAQAGSQFIEYLPIKSKARVLDPMVLLGPEDGSNRRRKLSEVDSEYKINLEVYRESKREEKTWRIEKLL